MHYGLVYVVVKIFVNIAASYLEQHILWVLVGLTLDQLPYHIRKTMSHSQLVSFGSYD